MSLKEPTNFYELKDFLKRLPFLSKCKCAIVACDESLKVWEDFVKGPFIGFKVWEKDVKQEHIEYFDLVVGAHHVVDEELPKKR